MRNYNSGSTNGSSNYLKKERKNLPANQAENRNPFRDRCHFSEGRMKRMRKNASSLSNVLFSFEDFPSTLDLLFCFYSEFI